MENKDFRSRLRNLQTESNPQAWQQMSDMLDALPAVEENKTKDKKWFLILLLLLGFALIFSAIRYNQSLHNTNVSEFPINKKNVSQQETVNKSGRDDNNINSITKSKLLESSEQEFNVTNSTFSESIALEREINSNSKKSESRPLKEPNQKKDLIQESQKDNNSDEESYSSAQKANELVTATRSINSYESPLSNQDKISSGDVEQRDSENSNSNQKEHNTGVGPKSTLNAFSTIHLLQFKEVYPNEQSKEYLLSDSRSQIHIPKNKKLYWFGSAGLGDINGSRGYYLGGGLFFDMDKVAALELDLGILGTKDRKYDIIETTRLLSSDIEVGVTLWLHLNLIRKRAHKLSLELGPSGQYDWNSTKVNTDSGGSTTISEFSGLYWNFRGGASYTYFINERSGIGIKGAFSLFDSGYVALKYYKKIN